MRLPGASILLRPPGVRYALAGWSRALRDGNYAVVLVRVVLPDTVEVEAGAVVAGSQAVGNVHDNCVTPVGLNGRSGDTAVDRQGHAFDAVRRNCNLDEVEPVLARNAGIGHHRVVVVIDAVLAPGCSGSRSVSRTRSACGGLGG